jgi:hypothetical protein
MTEEKTGSKDLVITKDLSLSSVNKIYEVGNYVKQIKEKHIRTNQKMEDYLQENTEIERRELEEVIAKFNKKMEHLREADCYKAMEVKLDRYEEKLHVTMTQVMVSYKKAVKQIYRCYPEQEEKHEKMLQFHKVIEDAFLSEDEKKIMKAIKDEIHAIPHRMITL